VRPSATRGEETVLRAEADSRRTTNPGMKEGTVSHHTPKDKVLNAMKKAGEPLTAAQIAEAAGLDKKTVDTAMAELKKSGAIVSPKRCCWEPA